MKILYVIGGGKVGLAVAKNHADNHRVAVIKRHPPSSKHQNLSVFTGDVTKAESLAEAFNAGFSTFTAAAFEHETVVTLLFCVSPSEYTEAAYQNIFVNGARNLVKTIEKLPWLASRLTRLFFISSTSVYGADDGRTVDENSETKPSGFAGETLIEAERILLEAGFPATVIRFSGIYGNGRGARLINQLKNNTARLTEKNPYTNRIHEIDCIGFISHLINKTDGGQPLESMYLASDNLPIRRNEVLCWLAAQLQLAPPLFEQSDETSSARMRGGSKRCQNGRMLESGYRLHHPDFRSGYAAFIGS